MKKNKCIVSGCIREMAIIKHGLCKAHMNRFYVHGEVGDGKIGKRKKHKPYVETKKLKDKFISAR